MYWAYVKFLQGPHIGNKRKVSTTKIKHKFDSLKFDDSKKYLVEDKDGKFYKCQIIFLEESESDLNHALNSKKLRMKPSSQLITADESESDSQARVAKTIGKDKQEEKLKKFSSLLNMRLDTLKKNLIPKSSESGNEMGKSVSEAGTYTTEDESEHIGNQAKLSDINSKNYEDNINAMHDDDNYTNLLISSKYKKDSDTTLLREPHLYPKVVIINSTNNVDNNSKNNPTSNEDNNSKNNPTNNEDNNSKDNNSKNNEDCGSMPSTSKTNISKTIRINLDKSMHSEKVCANRIQELEKKIKEMEPASKKNKQLKKENEKLRKKIDEWKEKFQNADNRAVEYEHLNINLQKKVIEKFDERQIIMNQTCNQPTDDIDMDVRKNYVPVGMLRESDNTIHIGRGERLSAAVFNNIIECSKTPSQCVGNIIVSVFPEKLLLTSTISGRSSNKSKSGSTEAKQHHQPNKLDSVKVQACQDLYNYWLKHEYSKLEPNFQYFEEAANFFEYASRKIAYLKRPSRSTPKKGKKAKSKSTHEDESHSPQTLEFVDMQALGAGEEPTNGENSKIINHEREHMDKKNENKYESEDSITEKVSEDEYSSIHDSEMSETDSSKDPLF